MFRKCATFQSRTFAAIYGAEHLETRLKAIQGLVDVRGNRPKVFQIDFLVDVWNRANYDFVDACMEGVRRIMRIAPPLVPREIKLPDWLGDQEPMELRYGNFLTLFR